MGWLVAAVLVIGVPTVWLLLVARRDRRGRSSSADEYGHKNGVEGAGQPHFAQPLREVNGGDGGGLTGL
jgi:hypothetical protein